MTDQNTHTHTHTDTHTQTHTHTSTHKQTNRWAGILLVALIKIYDCTRHLRKHRIAMT